MKHAKRHPLIFGTLILTITGLITRIIGFFYRIYLSRLFGEDGKESDSKRNMGIGLSVCMTIVRAHDGIMKAENRKEGGARVMFWLPKGVDTEYGD